ncbi:hypothetical protein [Geminisphaera colitermitum]|uniref:hypothetical protein n=1 Tax=Geminisphaera colitermitum TaxID=1148786 RepID=UPI000158CE17|nr:hypothetical protein [Geminisphaera colitermitum]
MPSHTTRTTAPADTALKLLARWARAAETDWTDIPTPSGQPAHGTYGTGYDGWGVQTQQKYASALATLATLGGRIQFPDTSWALDHALAALRYNLASHKSAPVHCTDNSKWGHTWISALGVERMMFGVQLLQPHFTDADHAALRAMLCSEADWLLTDYHRGPEKRITATRWNHEGGNDPESNIWNGALLWRASVMYPDHPRAADWQERAHTFLMNGVSVATDATDTRIVAGKPVRERYIGPCFFPNYALDHHGYLNVGYMTICVSNAAMLHLDLKAAGLPCPESLHHHQADLWAVLRQMIFDDGRLARIGGDTRVRYAYCQEYLMPALLYAADHLGDPAALEKLPPQLARITRETDADPATTPDNAYFYGARLAALRRQSPLYYTRLESDRACALGMIATYAPAVGASLAKPASANDAANAPVAVSVNAGVASDAPTWSEPEHGAALHRSATRFASFSWRAFNLAQGLCLPPDDGHLAEWEHNLGGLVEFCHHPHPTHGQWKLHRRVNRYHVDAIDGGFVTCGSVYEGVDLLLAESWSGTDSALHQVAFAALPDNHTVVAMHYCRMGNRRGYVASIKGLHLNVPNDLFNDYRRQLHTAAGGLTLTAPATQEELRPLNSRWVNIDNRIGAVGIYGPDTTQNTLTLHRAPHRRAGAMRSLHVEHICWPCEFGPKKFEAGEVILDAGWASLASVDAAQTAAFSRAHDAAAAHIRIDNSTTTIRALRVTGQDGRAWIFAANFGGQPATLSAAQLGLANKTGGIPSIVLDAGHARLLAA